MWGRNTQDQRVGWRKRRHRMRKRNCTHDRYVEPFQSLILRTTLHCRKTDQKRLPGDYPHVGVSRLPAIHTENVLISREPSLTDFESLLITVTLIE